MSDDETKRIQSRLTEVEVRLKALADADDNASWGRAAASRGGFRQERVELLEEARRIRARLHMEPPGA